MTVKVKHQLLKRWLKKVALFPLSILMGVDGDAAADTGPSLNERIMAFAGAPEALHMPVGPPDAAASEDEAADADQQGNQGEEADESNGLDTTADADPDADQDEEELDDAAQHDQKDEEGKGTRKKKFEDRVAEVAQKKLEEILSQRDQASQQERPDFTVVDQSKVNEFIANTEEQINELRLEGKYAEARKLSRQLDQLDADLEANEQKRLAWEQRQQQKQVSTVNVEAEKKAFDDVAELYRQELKVDPATWTQMAQWFAAQANSNKLVSAEFNEINARQGHVAAIRFAHDYTVKNMGQKTKQAAQQKEQSKTKAAALTATTTGKQAPVDLVKERAKLFATLPTDEAFTRYQALKRQAQG